MPYDVNWKHGIYCVCIYGWNNSVWAVIILLSKNGGTRFVAATVLELCFSPYQLCGVEDHVDLAFTFGTDRQIFVLAVTEAAVGVVQCWL